MLAETFYDSHLNAKYQSDGKIPKGYHVFPLSSGYKKGKHWIFTDTPTLYKTDPAGWFVSLKMDGVRATWMKQGSHFQFVSRGGKDYTPPKWFTIGFPRDLWFDGELWIPSRPAAEIAGLVRRSPPRDSDWEQVYFCVFDIVNPDIRSKPFVERYEKLKQWMLVNTNSHLTLVEQHEAKDFNHAHKMYRNIIETGGEGVVLRHPESPYVMKRSPLMLKWKPVLSAEAVIIGYMEGSGKFKNHLGAFRVHWIDQPTHIFKLSGKMDLAFRKSFVWKNGKLIQKGHVPSHIVTLEYMTINEKTGLPRQPIFVGFRLDA